MDSVTNIFIFVSDSMRWDTLPDNVRSLGPTYKTVASSCYSAPSFSSLATGRYPQRHGVSRWDDRIPSSVPTIFDLPEFQSGYHQESGGPDDDPLFSILRCEDDTSLDKLDEPFIAMERDLQPHVPFSGSGHSTAKEYYDSREDDWDTIWSEYREGCRRSAQRFQERIEYLKENDLLESTLCIFTSDHGELLGEHGEAGHSTPTVPELVYVPTTFVHPNIDSSTFNVSGNSIIEHVDLIQTGLSAVNASDHKTDGVDLLTNSRPRDWGYNHVQVEIKDRNIYAADSIWWPDGGFVLHQNSPLMRLAAVLYRILSGPEKRAVRKSAFSVAQSYLPSTRQYGLFPVSVGEAERILREHVQNIDTVSSDSSQLSDDAKTRLEDLGYVES